MPQLGIPTVYKGRQYRSRLEARWAAFFDLLKWPYEYEPFDLDGWIPDFLIKGETRLLVEVKPVVDFPKDIAREMVIAAHEARWTGELLILGVSLGANGYCDDDVEMGWIGEYSPDIPSHPEPPVGGFDPDNEETWEWYWSEACPYGSADKIGLSSYVYCWFDRIHRRPNFNQSEDGWCNGTGPVVESLWTKAGNLTQWHGRQSITS